MPTQNLNFENTLAKRKANNIISKNDDKKEIQKLNEEIKLLKSVIDSITNKNKLLETINELNTELETIKAENIHLKENMVENMIHCNDENIKNSKYFFT